MRDRGILFTVIFCLSAMPSFFGCYRSEGRVGDSSKEILEEVQPKRQADSETDLSFDSVEVQKLLRELRNGYADKNDDEIIQMLRNYASSDQYSDEGGMSWFTKRLGRARKQQKAVEIVKVMHGGISYDYQKGSSICKLEGKPDVPDWLRRLLTDHFFVNVVGVGLHGDDITNEKLICLQAFPNLEFIIIGCPKVTDDGLAHLVGFSHLEYLEIRDTQVSEEAIKKTAQALPKNCAIEWNRKWIRRPKQAAENTSETAR
jgi:hypothetical protein